MVRVGIHSTQEIEVGAVWYHVCRSCCCEVSSVHHLNDYYPFIYQPPSSTRFIHRLPPSITYYYECYNYYYNLQSNRMSRLTTHNQKKCHFLQKYNQIDIDFDGEEYADCYLRVLEQQKGSNIHQTLKYAFAQHITNLTFVHASKVEELQRPQGLVRHRATLLCVVL